MTDSMFLNGYAFSETTNLLLQKGTSPHLPRNFLAPFPHAPQHIFQNKKIKCICLNKHEIIIGVRKHVSIGTITIL